MVCRTLRKTQEPNLDTSLPLQIIDDAQVPIPMPRSGLAWWSLAFASIRYLAHIHGS
jgi:hypothetical protein